MKLPLRESRIDARDLRVGAGVAAIALVLYLVTAQARVKGDGISTATGLARGDWLWDLHLGYSALLSFVHRLVGSPHPAEFGRLFFPLVGATALFCFFLFLRHFASRSESAWVTAFVGASPSVWFYSTTLEIHALSLLAASAGLLAVVAASRSRGIALLCGLGCVCFSGSYLLHPVGLLAGLGWVCLIVMTEQTPTTAALVRRVIVVGAVLMLSAFASNALLHYALTGAARLPFVHEGGAFQVFAGNLPVPIVAWYGFVFPFAVVLLLALKGVVGSASSLRTIGLAGALPTVVILLFVFRVPERGGYLLASLPFLGLLASAGCANVPRSLLACALVLQVGITSVSIVRNGSQFDPEVRAAAVRGILAGESRSIVVSGETITYPIWIDVPGVLEISVLERVNRAIYSERDAGDFVRGLLAAARESGLEEGRVLFDLSYRDVVYTRDALFDELGDRRKGYLDQVVDLLMAEFGATEMTDFDWPFLVVDVAGGQAPSTGRATEPSGAVNSGR